MTRALGSACGLSVHVSVMAPQRGVCNRKVVIGEKFPSKFAGVGNKAYLCTRISKESNKD